jgi:hypothetical protein
LGDRIKLLLSYIQVRVQSEGLTGQEEKRQEKRQGKTQEKRHDTQSIDYMFDFLGQTIFQKS